jgi:hypothetical protein
VEQVVVELPLLSLAVLVLCKQVLVELHLLQVAADRKACLSDHFLPQLQLVKVVLAVVLEVD